MCEYWLFHTVLGQNLKSDPLNMMAEHDDKIQNWHFYICVCVCVKMICRDTVWPLRACAMHGRPQWKQLLQHNHKPHSQAPSPTHFADDILIISQNLHAHSPLYRHVSGCSHKRACLCVCVLMHVTLLSVLRCEMVFSDRCSWTSGL